MRLLTVILVFVGLAFPAQAPKMYMPTEIQLLRLQVKQREAQLAQKDAFIAQMNFNRAVKALSEEAAKIKMENDWPDNLVFNQEKLTFVGEAVSKLPSGDKLR